MSEETTSQPRINVVSSESSDGELALLRKEVVEARNLVIKTDNLLKNLHAELKQMGKKHEDQERRHWMTSVTAYVAFAVIASAGAFAYARIAVQSAREEAVQNESRAKQLQHEAEKIKAGDQTRREASERALRAFDLLGSEKEGPGLNQAMSQALHLDRSQLSALESKAIDDRAAGMKARIAQNSLERGNRAFRQQDWKTASVELGRYTELEPRVDDALVWYHLGTARIQAKEWQGAIPALEQYLKLSSGTKTSQYAGMLLGQAYEEVGNHGRAKEVYERAASLYPGSDFASMIRTRLRRIAQAQAQTPAGAAPAATAGR